MSKATSGLPDIAVRGFVRATATVQSTMRDWVQFSYPPATPSPVTDGSLLQLRRMLPLMPPVALSSNLGSNL